MRPEFLAWAQSAVAIHGSFRGTILKGTFYPLDGSASTTDLLRRSLVATGHSSESADEIIGGLSEIEEGLLLQELRPRPALALLRSQAGALEVIADFLGVLHGRELRNARELADCFVAMGV